MIELNRKVLSVFVEADRCAALRLYLLVRNDYSGNLQRRHFNEVCDKLGTNIRYLRKLIKHCIELGMLVKSTNYWYRIRSWRLMTGVTKKSRSESIKVKRATVSGSEGLQYLRAIYMAFAVREAYKVARRLSKEDIETGKATTSKRHGRLGKFAPVSASFVSIITKIPFDTKTIEKWIVQAEKYKLIEVYRKHRIRRVGHYPKSQAKSIVKGLCLSGQRAFELQSKKRSTVMIQYPNLIIPLI